MSRDSSRIISVIVPGPKYYIIHNVQIHIRAATILFLPITFIILKTVLPIELKFSTQIYWTMF